VLSAKNEERLKEYAGKLAEFIRTDSDIESLWETSQQKVLEEKIRAILSEILQVDAAEIDVNEKFGDYGMEPVHKNRLLEKLQEEFNVEINSKDFLDKDSVALIVKGFLENHSSSLEGIQQAGIKTWKPEISLADIAYTLQVGREPMEERMGLIVGSVQELEKKLRGFLEGRNDVEALHRGHVRRNKEALALFASDKLMAKTVDTWISERKYSKLLELWVKGLALDWNRLYGEPKPSRISAPTYPFARVRCWAPGTDNQTDAKTPSQIAPASMLNKISWDELAWLPKWEEQSASIHKKHTVR